jgi:hypothetical protein
MIRLAAVSITLSVMTLLAQARPSFEGRWVEAGAGSEPSEPLVVVQSGDAIEVENWSRRGPVSGVRAWAGATSPESLRVSWRGQMLVVEYLRGGQGAGLARTEAWSIDRSNKLNLTIEQGGASQGRRSVESYVYTRVPQGVSEDGKNAARANIQMQPTRRATLDGTRLIWRR